MPGLISPTRAGAKIVFLSPAQHSRADCAPAVQAAIALNTKPIVARNMAAGRVQISRERVPLGAVLSPCSQLVAWITSRGVTVQRCCGRSQVASLPLPAPSQASSPCWSRCSSYVAVWCVSVGDQCSSAWDQYALVLEVASGRAHKLLLSQSRFSALPLPELAWAPTAPRLAVFYTDLSQAPAPRRLCLVDAAGGMPDMVFRAEAPPCKLPPLWSSNGRALAFCGPKGFAILDAASSKLYKAATWAGFIVAWSPSSWAEPHLLWLTGQRCFRDGNGRSPGTAQLFDASAQHRGMCGVPIEHQASEMVWGRQGLAVLHACGLLLCGVTMAHRRLHMHVKHRVEPPVPARGLLLSWDEQHLCSFRVASQGFGETGGSSCGNACSFDMVVISFETGCQVTISPSGGTSRGMYSRYAPLPQCSWSKSGHSLSMSFRQSLAAGADAGCLFYIIFRFVC